MSVGGTLTSWSGNVDYDAKEELTFNSKLNLKCLLKANIVDMLNVLDKLGCMSNWHFVTRNPFKSC